MNVPSRQTCRSSGNEFTQIVDETKCAICSDPEGFARFCDALARHALREERERNIALTRAKERLSARQRFE